MPSVMPVEHPIEMVGPIIEHVEREFRSELGRMEIDLDFACDPGWTYVRVIGPRAVLEWLQVQFPQGCVDLWDEDD